jgi:hypothetical protein
MGKSLTGSRPPGKQLAKACVEFAIRASKSDTAYGPRRLQATDKGVLGSSISDLTASASGNRLLDRDGCLASSDEKIFRE